MGSRGRALAVIGDDESAVGAVFQHVTLATRLNDGSVAVGTNAGEIVLFDERGERLRSMGRRGGGPGEFSGPAGRFVAAADLPAEFTILEIGEDYLNARTTGAYDVQHVEVWRLSRDGPTIR